MCVRLVHRKQIQVLIHHLHFRRHNQIGRRDRPFTPHLQAQAGGLHIIQQLQPQLLDLQDELGHILAHAGDLGKLMQHIADAHRGHRGARQRGQQHPPQRVAQRDAVATFQWTDNKPTVITQNGLALNLGHHQIIRAEQSGPPSPSRPSSV